MRVLLLEDDMLLSEIITEYLESLGYETTAVYTGYEAEDLVYAQKFDLLLLDVNVPKLNGFEFLKSFRTTGDKTPAIFITSLHESSDLLEGFNAGCDDYIKKPFDLVELKARIDNIKRHFQIENREIYKINDEVSYDESIKTVFIKEDSYKLANKEAQILEYFLKHSSQVISIDEFIANIWSYEDSPSAATIRTYIKNLRKLLGESSIITIKGVGYRFNA